MFLSESHESLIRAVAAAESELFLPLSLRDTETFLGATF